MTGEACEQLVAIGLVFGVLLAGHLVVLMDIERARLGRRRWGRR
ncbi:MAG: hypothetical protein OXH69_23235 [Acidobacteria bacterium]|nr:hypothetical protein [Acidobacteriota bacterium]